MNTTDPASLPSRLRVRHDDLVPVLVVPAGMPFERLREWIRATLPDALPELGGQTCRLDLGDREIELFDVRRLLHLLRDEFRIEVTGLYVRPQAIHRYAERELKLKLFPTDPPSEPVDPEEDLPEVEPEAAPEATDDEAPAAEAPADPASDDDDEPPPEAFEPVEPLAALRRPIPLPDLKEEDPEVDDQGGRRVLSVHRTLRSGSSVRYDGDVYVYGDVNAGAQVRAGGNIVVFGKLRGMVHAGAHGDEGAFILAFDLAPTQLRIGKHIAIAPERPPSDRFEPELARVDGDGIVVEPFRGSIPRR